jgi:hypothetical protein
MKTGILVFALALVGCAIGPRLREREATMPQPPDQGRLYIYRPTQFWESMIQPRLVLDDKYIGDAVPGGVRVVDLPPGLHCLTVEQSVLAPGSGSPTRCVELRAGGREYLHIMLGSYDVPKSRYYTERWRNSVKQRVYEGFEEDGPCRDRPGVLCETYTKPRYYNDARQVDATIGQSEVRELVLLEPTATR